MELKEMIKVMQHFEDGGEVDFREKKYDMVWRKSSDPSWNWYRYDYQIKVQKVTIEKWLCQDNQGYFVVIETSDIDAYIYHEKLKLLETYEVEL